eukprot:CCRYP_012188-RA/>CCRYP_012188-RA protein AED:0.24 eAED:0.24 QI:0/-1/0/1/-1/1/1/0/175
MATSTTKFCKSRSSNTTKAASQAMRRRITFSATSTLIITQPKTTQEMKSSWYTQAEMMQFKQNSALSAELVLDRKFAWATTYIAQSTVFCGSMSRVYVPGVEEVCGIEHLLSNDLRKILKATKVRTIRQVLEEQDRQNEMNENDAEKIAQVSRKASAFSRKWRHGVACLNYNLKM